MAEYWLERRLTAILAADVLGPLWLMILRGENFESTAADIEVGPAEETSAEIGALGQHRPTVQVNLCDLADINGMVDTVGSEMGGIDAVDNNGDLGYGQGIEL